MKKYKFGGLGIEITRRCNKKCLHCMNGKPQNLTITKEIIDKIFADIDDATNISILGGESLLEMDMIEYLIQKINDSNWMTRTFQLTTNGTICDSRIINLLELFCSKGENIQALIRISNDQFHDADEYTKAYSFYKTHIEKANEKISKLNPGSGIVLKYTIDDHSEIETLLYAGNAVNIIDLDGKHYIHGQTVRYPVNSHHRIKIVGDLIPCKIVICSNGDVALNEEMSYKDSDKSAIGNIMESHLTDIINQHNDSCVVLCSEIGILHFFNNRKWYKNNRDFDYNSMEFIGLICRRIIELREKAKSIFPNVPISDIISILPFPDHVRMLELLYDIYAHCPNKNDKLIEKMIFGEVKKNPPLYQRFPAERRYDKAPIYQRALIMAVNTYLKDSSERKYPYELFGNEHEILGSTAFGKLRDLNEFYRNNPSIAKNHKVFPCKLADIESISDLCNIDYQEEYEIDT